MREHPHRTPVLAKQDVNTGRQFEADMAKFVCMIGMVIVHCFDVFVSFSETSSGVQYAFLFVLNSIFGAGTFMFCMGLGTAYSGSTPKALMKRGIRIFLIGYLLNLACALSYLILLRDVSLFVTYLIGPDILQFAGLALLLFGFLQYVKCPDWGIGAIAVALSLIATWIRTVTFDSSAANLILGLFIGSFDYEWMTGGVFPLFNWFIFVAAGYLFAKYLLRKCTRKTAMYGLLSGVSAVLLAVYLGIAIPNGSGMMGSILRFHHLGILDAVVCIAGTLFALGVYHMLFGRLPGSIRSGVTRVSKDILPIYCIQWVILAWSVSVWVLCGEPVLPDGVIILIGIAIFVLSAAAARAFSRRRSRIAKANQ